MPTFINSNEIVKLWTKIFYHYRTWPNTTTTTNTQLNINLCSQSLPLYNLIVGWSSFCNNFIRRYDKICYLSYHEKIIIIRWYSQKMNGKYINNNDIHYIHKTFALKERTSGKVKRATTIKLLIIFYLIYPHHHR